MDDSCNIIVGMPVGQSRDRSHRGVAGKRIAFRNILFRPGVFDICTVVFCGKTGFCVLPLAANR